MASNPFDFRHWFAGGEALKFAGGDQQASPVYQFASWLPYSVYLPREQLFVNRDSIGFMIEATPQTGADDGMIDVLPSIYSTLPRGAGMQFSLFASPHILDPLRDYGNMRVEDPDAKEAALPHGRPARNKNLFRMLARRRAGDLLRGSHPSLTRGYQYTVRNFRLIISLVLRGGIDDIAIQERLLIIR